MTESEGTDRRGRGAVAADRIRILIVDDHALFRAGIANALSRERDLDVVGEAADGRSALEAAGSTSPNIVLMDLSLPAPAGSRRASASVASSRRPPSSSWPRTRTRSRCSPRSRPARPRS